MTISSSHTVCHNNLPYSCSTTYIPRFVHLPYSHASSFTLCRYSSLTLIRCLLPRLPHPVCFISMYPTDCGVQWFCSAIQQLQINFPPRPHPVDEVEQHQVEPFMYDGREPDPENDAPPLQESHCSNLSAPIASRVPLGHETG